jgi:hypothetical protein
VKTIAVNGCLPRGVQRSLGERGKETKNRGEETKRGKQKKETRKGKKNEAENTTK